MTNKKRLLISLAEGRNGDLELAHLMAQAKVELAYQYMTGGDAVCNKTHRASGKKGPVRLVRLHRSKTPIKKMAMTPSGSAALESSLGQ